MSPPEINLDALPPEVRAFVEAERAARMALEAKVVALSEHNARLEHLVAELRRALYGRRSEKLSPEERELAAEDLEAAVSEAESDRAAAEGDNDGPGTTTKAPRGKGKPRASRQLPADLERLERVIEPESVECPCGCGTMARIGEDRSERLDVVPARVRVLVTVRPRYACRRCSKGVVQAPAPAWLIESALPTERTIAHVLVAKFCDHVPFYRQARMLARAGVEIDRAALADWAGKAAFHLKPVVERLGEHLRGSTRLFVDETTLPVLDPGRGRTKTGYLWALARDERRWGGTAPPGVVYHYAPGRGTEHARAVLAGVSGTIQVDGYAAYKAIARERGEEKPLVLAHCWAHGRRQLRELFERDGSRIAGEGLRHIAELYAIEAEIVGLSPEERRAARQERTRPLVDAFDVWLDAQRARVSPKSRVGEKLAYFARHRDGLRVFLDDGRIEMDTNIVENTIRPQALTRRNSLFAGHDEGARTWARIASLIETARLNGVEPLAYLTTTLEAIAAGHPQSRLDELLPWAFRPTSS